MLVDNIPLSKIYEVVINYIDPVTEEEREAKRKIRGLNAYDAMAFCLKEVADEVSRKSRNKADFELLDHTVLTADAKLYEETKENQLEELAEKETELILVQY